MGEKMGKRSVRVVSLFCAFVAALAVCCGAASLLEKAGIKSYEFNSIFVSLVWAALFVFLTGMLRVLFLGIVAWLARKLEALAKVCTSKARFFWFTRLGGASRDLRRSGLLADAGFPQSPYELMVQKEWKEFSKGLDEIGAELTAEEPAAKASRKRKVAGFLVDSLFFGLAFSLVNSFFLVISFTSAKNDRREQARIYAKARSRRSLPSMLLNALIGAASVGFPIGITAGLLCANRKERTTA